MPINLHDVLPAIVVNINESASPRDILVVDPYARRERYIAKSSVPVVVVEVASVVGEVGLKMSNQPSQS